MAKTTIKELYDMGQEELRDRVQLLETIAEDCEAKVAEATLATTQWRRLYWGLRRVVSKLSEEWREVARRVNQPKSPSIFVECAEELEHVLAEHNEPFP